MQTAGCAVNSRRYGVTFGFRYHIDTLAGAEHNIVDAFSTAMQATILLWCGV